MAETTEKLGKILFVPRRSGMIFQTPGFLTDETGEIIYNAYCEKREELFRGNKHFKLKRNGREIVGANVPDANLIDQIVRQYGVRTSLPKDWDEEFMQMIDEKYYTTANALVFRSMKDNYNKENDKIARILAESGKVDIERLAREPTLITGSDIQPSDDKGYGFIAVPTEGFNVHYDERFLEKYNRWRFDNTDEIGMPVGLDKQKGKRVWYTKDDGISGFVLDCDRDLFSGDDGLSGSCGGGRVVLVAAEVGALNFLKVLEQQQRSELLEKTD